MGGPTGLISHVIPVGKHDGRQAAQCANAPGQGSAEAGGIDQHIAASLWGPYQQVAGGPKAQAGGPAAVVDVGLGMAHQKGRESLAHQGGAVALEKLSRGADRRHGAGLLGQQGPDHRRLSLRLVGHPGLALAGREVGRIPAPAGAAIDAAGINVERAWGVGGQAAGRAGHPCARCREKATRQGSPEPAPQ